MSNYTIQQYCQAIFSIQAQITVVRDAIAGEETSFEEDDQAFLDYTKILMTIFLEAVDGPLNDCLVRHEIKDDMSVNPPPFGGEGC